MQSELNKVYGIN